MLNLSTSLVSVYANASKGYDALLVQDLRGLEGQHRIDWLASLSGKAWDKMSPTEYDVSRSILTGIEVNKIIRMSDENITKAMKELAGVSEHERTDVIKILKTRSHEKTEKLERNIRKFLKSPFKHIHNAPKALRHKAWHDAEGIMDLVNILIDELPETKQTRNDKITPVKAHFWEPMADYIASLKDGLLPYEVTKMNVLNKYGDVTNTLKLAEHHQSIELIFMVMGAHDLIEDILKATFKFLGDYSEAEKMHPEKAKFFVDCIRKITFKYKEMVNGVEQTLSDHGFDFNAYARSMWDFWPSRFNKVKDRGNGISSRYPWHILVPEFFSHKKDVSYNEDTIAVLKHGRLLEQGAQQFPELKPYSDFYGLQLQILHRNFEFFTMNNKAHENPLRKSKAKTSLLDINDFAKDLSQYPNYHLKMSDIRHQYHTLVVKAVTYPHLKKTVDVLGEQLKYHLPKGMGLKNNIDISRAHDNDNRAFDIK